MYEDVQIAISAGRRVGPERCRECNAPLAGGGDDDYVLMLCGDCSALTICQGTIFYRSESAHA